METKLKFQLISGEYSPQDSLEVLMSLFTSKIKFHELKNFSSLERDGKENKISIKKINQLKTDIENIQKILKEANEKNLQIKITSNVKIEFGKK
jgi:ribosome-interacting GTPase 1